jgi:ATP-dependent Lon protease
MRQETGQSQSAIGPYIEEHSPHAVMQNLNFEVSVHNDGTVAHNPRSDDRAWQIIPPSPHSATAVPLEEVGQATEILDSRANPSTKGRQKNNATSSTSEGISSGLFTFRVETSASTSVAAAQSRSGPSVSVSTQQQANGAVRRITTRRSRYSTLPSHLDQSITALVDELESTTALRDTIQHLEGKVNQLEQALKIEEGRARLAQQEEHERLGTENASLRRELISKTEEVCSLRDQRREISEELETLKGQVAERNEDMASWRKIMKTIMHE